MDEEDHIVHIPKTLNIVLSHVVKVQRLNLVSFYTTFSPALETQARCVDHPWFSFWPISSPGV